MQCFVMMPFRDDFDDVYAIVKGSVESAVSETQMSALRLDETRSAGRITDDMLTAIRSSDLCIADVTASNPDVMWEVGYPAALQKPLLLISQTTEDLPFDIKDLRLLKYERSALAKTLAKELAASVRQTVSSYGISGRSRSMPLPQFKPVTIAVTGSGGHIRDPLRAREKIEQALGPYVRSETKWLCRAKGTVDEAAAEFLFEHGQEVSPVRGEVATADNIVGQAHPRKPSSRILELVKQYGGQIIEAKWSELSHIRGAPSSREVLFAQKANLVILVWDSQTKGTAEIIGWFRSIGKDHLVSFL